MFVLGVVGSSSLVIIERVLAAIGISVHSQVMLWILEVSVMMVNTVVPAGPF